MKRKELFQGLVFSLIWLLAMANNGAADTPVSGIIDSDTTWTLAGSPYIVTGSVLVSSGVTLTIDPGVVVKFEGRKALQIEGIIIAIGTPENMITFTSNQSIPSPGDWGYIHLTDTRVGSILTYCEISYAGYNVDGAVYLDSSSLFITNCIIRNNQASGIYAINPPDLRILSNQITNNEGVGDIYSNVNGCGIYISGGKVEITDNMITNNRALGTGSGGGISVRYVSEETVINNNTIEGNSGSGNDSGVGGILVQGNSAIVTIENNAITNNEGSSGYDGQGGGVKVISNSADVVIDNNYIAYNKTYGGHEGSGINTGQGGFGPKGYAIITNNIIVNNRNGGISIASDNDQSIITGNIIKGNTSHGIKIFSGGATITKNVVEANTGYGVMVVAYGSSSNSVAIDNNSIIYNTEGGILNYDENIQGGSLTNAEIRYNLIIDNNLETLIEVYLAYWLIQNNNIIKNNLGFALNYRGPTRTILTAENNWWNTTTDSEIQEKIYDWNDDGSRGIVDYSPFLTSHDTTAPISPPTGLTATPGSITLEWSANPESDVAGYKVYWGTQPAPFFENVVDVGNTTSYTITGDAYYIGVTAYDTDYADANDDPDTIVNENQTNGNESWYAFPTTPLEIPSITVNPDPIDFGDVIVGRRYEVTLEIGNDGNADLKVTNITHNLGKDLKINPSPPYEPPLTVAPGATTTVTLTFTVSIEGEISGTLSIESNDPTSPTEIDISAVAKILVGDLSGNGSVSAYDAALILQFVVGLITEFPIERMMRPSPYDVEPRNYEISIPDVTVKQGERVQVPIVVNDAKGMQAAGIVVKYDSSILRAIDVMPTSTLSNSYWECNTKRNEEIRFAFASMKPIEGGDKLLILEFETLPDTEGTVSPLILDQVKLSESLSITKKNGSITVLPSKTLLLQNYPNPFNPETRIPYQLATDSPVTISIYNSNGQMIRTISLGTKQAGVYLTKDKAAYWDGKDSFGEKVASGIYFYTLQAGNFRATRKMVILK